MSSLVLAHDAVMHVDASIVNGPLLLELKRRACFYVMDYRNNLPMRRRFENFMQRAMAGDANVNIALVSVAHYSTKRLKLRFHIAWTEMGVRRGIWLKNVLFVERKLA